MCCSIFLCAPCSRKNRTRELITRRLKSNLMGFSCLVLSSSLFRCLLFPFTCCSFLLVLFRVYFCTLSSVVSRVICLTQGKAPLGRTPLHEVESCVFFRSCVVSCRVVSCRVVSSSSSLPRVLLGFLFPFARASSCFLLMRSCCPSP